jgi:hypothetical protein
LSHWKRQRNSRSRRNLYQQSLPPSQRQFLLGLSQQSLYRLAQVVQLLTHSLYQTSHSLGSLSVSSDYGDRDGEREVVPGVLRGYRAWRWDEGSLAACNWGTRWTSGRNEAVCYKTSACPCDSCKAGLVIQQANPHLVVPEAECACGIYAKHLPGNYDYRGLVIGVIKAYGKVILGTKGFRAQYAEIEALAIRYDQLSSGYSDLVETLTQYQVPIFVTEYEMVEKFPPIPVTELLPKEEAIRAYGYHRMVMSMDMTIPGMVP